MDSKYDSIVSDVRYGDDVVLNTSDGDSEILELVQRLKDGGYRVLEEGAGGIVLRQRRREWRGRSIDDRWDQLLLHLPNVDCVDDLFGPRVEFHALEDGERVPGPREESDDDPANWNWAIDDVKVEHKETVTLENHEDQTIFVLLYFKTAYRNRGSDSSRPSTSEVRLVLDEVRFGVENSVLENYELGAFVHQIEISVEPAPSWLQDCNRLRNVCPALSPPMFDIQVGSSPGTGLTLGKGPNATLSYETTASIKTVSPAFAWLPASSEWRTKSVKWGWRINRWNDSTPFKVNRPSSFASRFGTGDFRELPFHRPSSPPGEVNYRRNLLDAEATWEVPTAAIEKSGSIQWTVAVKLLTAHVHRVVIIPPNLALKCRVTKGYFHFNSEVSLKVETNVH